MCGMSRHTQTAYTVGVLTHVWALRAAVVADAPGISEVTMPRRPFTCWMNLHHVWRWYTAEDGSRYRRCGSPGHLAASVGTRTGSRGSPRGVQIGHVVGSEPARGPRSWTCGGRCVAHTAFVTHHNSKIDR